ncbi:S8 family serine peptidase [bacterium]|nr:S8 family serine peptidase [bacterium]
MKKWLIAFIAFLLLIPFGFQPSVLRTEATERLMSVKIDIINPDQTQEIESSGILIEERYPAYILGKATELQFKDLVEKRLPVTKMADSDKVYINGFVIYPTKDDTKSFIVHDMPIGFRTEDIIEKPVTYFLIKFKSPAKKEWIDEITLKGGELVEHYHINSYALRATKVAAEDIRRLPYISAVMEFMPFFKVYPSYHVEEGYQIVYATLWTKVDIPALRKDIKTYAEGVMLSLLELEDFSVATLLLPNNKIPTLARIPDIAYVELPPDKIELKNDIARKIVTMDFVDQEYTSGRIATRLDGSGQTVAVFDSGLDNGSYTSLHQDFRGRVRYAYKYAPDMTYQDYGGVNYFSNPPVKDQYWFAFRQDAGRVRAPNNGRYWNDVWGHGTHVTGIIAGNGSASGGQYKGIAPGAGIIVQRMTANWRWDDTSRPNSSYQYQDQRWPARWPAKYHTQHTLPAIWDLAAPPGGTEHPAIFNWTNEVAYKYDLLPGYDPGQREVTTYHDVPQVAGEVFGPRNHPITTPTSFYPEEGDTTPLSPNFEGVAGNINFAMYDAYYRAPVRAHVMNNSWWYYFIRAYQTYSPDPGSPVFNTYDYNVISRIVDNFQYYQPDFLTVWAAGDNGRDRDLDGIVDSGDDVDNDLMFGNPRKDGENQQFFAPAPVKNGLTVGACENYRPTLDIYYGNQDAGSPTPRANFGLFLTGATDLPNWGDVIAADKIADGNQPLDAANFPPPYEENERVDIERGYPDSVDATKFVQQTAGKFAMASISTRGRTSDGRIKPDLVAPGTMIISNLSSHLSTTFGRSGPPGRTTGRQDYPFEWNFVRPSNTNYVYMSGTSTSAAFVSGAALITRQYYVALHDLTIAPMPTASLVKATLIHGATNMAMTGYPNQYDQILDGQRIDEAFDDTQHIADTSQGWGRLNIYKALFPLAPRVQRFDDNITGIDADVISYKVNVDNTDVPFEVTLVWSDESAAPNTWPVLKHNLDLVVVDPAGIVYRGNQFGQPPTQDPNISVPMATGTDTLNNVERIIIPKPKIKGEYRISVIPSSLPKAPGGPVKYAIVYSGGFSDLPAEQPIPVMNRTTLLLLGALLLGIGLFGIRKGLVAKKQA